MVYLSLYLLHQYVFKPSANTYYKFVIVTNLFYCIIVVLYQLSDSPVATIFKLNWCCRFGSYRSHAYIHANIHFFITFSIEINTFVVISRKVVFFWTVPNLLAFCYPSWKKMNLSSIGLTGFEESDKKQTNKRINRKTGIVLQ